MLVCFVLFLTCCLLYFDTGSGTWSVFFCPSLPRVQGSILAVRVVLCRMSDLRFASAWFLRRLHGEHQELINYFFVLTQGPHVSPIPLHHGSLLEDMKNVTFSNERQFYFLTER